MATSGLGSTCFGIEAGAPQAWHPAKDVASRLDHVLDLHNLQYISYMPSRISYYNLYIL